MRTPSPALAPLLAWTLALALVSGGSAQVPPARDVMLTVGDDMKFNIETIEAAPGERLRVLLKSIGVLPKIAMAHNFVLLAGGVDPVAFTKQSVHGVPPDFLPPNAARYMLAATPLAGPGETVEVTFNAPRKPGRYTYLCAYPGHFMSGSRGTLVVSAVRRSRSSPK